jgi:cell division protein FtsI/penicillin-binding protein 2
VQEVISTRQMPSREFATDDLFRHACGLGGHACRTREDAPARREAALTGIAVAGKTGTAETGRPTNQAWFIAFAPADAPRVAVAVTIEDTPATGGEVAAPLAANVLRAALAVADPP